MAATSSLFVLLLLDFAIGFVSAVDHIHIVDTNEDQSVVLVRGGTPVNSDNPPTVSYDDWIDDISTSAKSAGVPLSLPLFLVDINVMNFESNRDISETLIEHDFFSSNPSLGQFMFWSTVGTLGNISNPLFGATEQDLSGQPVKLSQALKDILLNAQMSYLPDRMIERQDQLWDLVHNPNNPTIQAIRANNPKVGTIIVYGHCDCGCDRTGQTFGSYYLRHLNWSWEAANTMNTIIAGRGMSCNNYLAMQWYCFYLNVALNYTNNCQINFECSPDWPQPPNVAFGSGLNLSSRTQSSCGAPVGQIREMEKQTEVIKARSTPIWVVEKAEMR